MTAQFFETRARFLKANQQRFTDWGEADNYRITGAGLDEFYDLFVLLSDYYERLRWFSKQRPVWYRQQQLARDAVERLLRQKGYQRQREYL